MKIIILLGRQGSGKGTQAKLFIQEFEFAYLGSGDLLRSFYDGSSFSAKKTKQVLNAGGYVPTPVIFRLWMDKLESIKEKSDLKGILFDGSPRKLLEAHLLDQAFGWYEWEEYVKVILIDISREEAMERLTKRRICVKCGKIFPWVGEFKRFTACDACGGELTSRPDDTPEGIKSRLDLFESETMPVIEYYKQSGRLEVIHGEQDIDDVYRDLKGSIVSS